MPRPPKSLFTVIMEYRGGTFIRQVRAHDVVGALRVWAKELEHGEVQHLGEARKRELIASIEEDLCSGLLPSPINETKNVWCATGSCSGGFMLINLIKTAEPREGWAESSREMAALGDDKLLDPPTPTSFDDKEWKW